MNAILRYRLSFVMAIVFTCITAIILYLLLPTTYTGTQASIFHGTMTDFDGHIFMARKMMYQHSLLVVPHPLWHIMFIGLHRLVPRVSVELLAHFVLPILCQAICASGIFCFLIRSRAKPYSLAWLTICLMASEVLLLVGPINFLIDEHRFVGYIPTNIYWSPTALLAKPFTIWLFFLVTDLLQTSKAGRKLLVIIGLTTMLALLAKPSYIIAIIPVVGILALVDVLAKRRMRAFQIAVALLVPAGLVLLCQLYVFSVGQEMPSHIIFSPLGPMRALCSNHLALRCVLSLCFPLSVILLFPKQAIASLPLKFAWCTTLVGLLYTYLLAESDIRFAHLNFIWSAELALFTVFAASIQLLLENFTPNENLTKPRYLIARTVFCSVVLFLHIIGGVLLNYCAGRLM